jgi:hypothetical protein
MTTLRLLGVRGSNEEGYTVVCVLTSQEWWGITAAGPLLAATGPLAAGLLGAGGIEANVPTRFYAEIAERFAPSSLRPPRAISLSRKNSPSQTSNTDIQEIQRRCDLADGGAPQIPPRELRTSAQR